MALARVMFGMTAVVLAASTCAGGPVNPPPGPVSPTYKTLQQVEPRVPLETVPGDSEAMHVITEPGSYYLTGNVTLAPGKTTWVRYSASNVTLDLMGFEVNGASKEFAVGVRPVSTKAGYSGLVVKNGSFTRWFQGINAMDGGYTQGGRMESLVFNETLLTGMIAPDFAVIVNCSASNCGADCFVIYNGGSFDNSTARSAGNGFNAGHGASLLNCQAQDCGTGFYCAFDNTLTNCGAVYCGTGFYGLSGHAMTGCNAQKCSFGFVLSDRSVLTGCAAAFCGGDGVQVGGFCSLINCNFSGNGQTGVHVFFDNNAIETVNSSYNAGTGMLMETLANNSVVRGGQYSGNDGNGISINSARVRVEGNHAVGNGGNGVSIAGFDCLIIGNSACGNGTISGVDYAIAPANAAGPVLAASDLATNPNPHANFNCGANTPSARTNRLPADRTPPGPRTGPGVGRAPLCLTPSR